MLTVSIAATGRNGSCPRRSASTPTPIRLTVAARLRATSSRPAAAWLMPRSTA